MIKLDRYMQPELVSEDPDSDGAVTALSKYWMNFWGRLLDRLIAVEYNGREIDGALRKVSSFFNAAGWRVYACMGNNPRSAFDRIRTTDGENLDDLSKLVFLAVVPAQAPESIQEAATNWMPVATYDGKVYVYNHTDKDNVSVFRLANNSDRQILEPLFDDVDREVLRQTYHPR